jgi:hypothetical protein
MTSRILHEEIEPEAEGRPTSPYVRKAKVRPTETGTEPRQRHEIYRLSAIALVTMLGASARETVPNSLAYRNPRTGAIQTKADIVHIATWSDFSESTNVAPVKSSTATAGMFLQSDGLLCDMVRNRGPAGDRP